MKIKEIDIVIDRVDVDVSYYCSWKCPFCEEEHEENWVKNEQEIKVKCEKCGGEYNFIFYDIEDALAYDEDDVLEGIGVEVTKEGTYKD